MQRWKPVASVVTAAVAPVTTVASTLIRSSLLGLFVRHRRVAELKMRHARVFAAQVGVFPTQPPDYCLGVVEFSQQFRIRLEGSFPFFFAVAFVAFQFSETIIN
jgi:hypothetical protein